MPQYKATFLVPAQVLVTVTVGGDDQQQGLVAAHDALRLASLSNAQVVSIDVDSFELKNFQRQEDGAPPAPPAAADPRSPLAASDTYSVTFYSGTGVNSTVSAKSPQNLSYEEAKRLADGVLAPLSPYGYAVVRDRDLAVKYFNQAPRGGSWEVEALSDNPAIKDKVCTGLISEASAKSQAMQLFLTKNFSRVRVLDATERTIPPVLVRELGK
jgi:hypothetical protein